MKRFGSVARLVAVFTVLFALSGMPTAAFAQDVSGTPVADDAGATGDAATSDGTDVTDQTGTTETTDNSGVAAATYYVSVSCSPVGDGSQTACSFIATSSDGSAIEALWVPAWIACADIVDTGGADSTGDGYHVLADTLTLTFAGTVGPGGSAGYVVRVNGTPVDVSGDALVCGDAGVIDDGGPVATDSSGNESAGTDGVTTDEAPAATAGESTPEATDEGTNTGSDVSAAAVVQAQVDVNVVVYNCTADPAGADPSTSGDCVAADGVDVSATEDGNDLGTQTTASGTVVFMATVGTAFVATEDVPADHQPIGNGSATIDPVVETATIVFVNVANDAQGDPQLGRLQIVHGSCPTSNPRDPKFIVIPPKSFQAQADETCEPTPGAVLTITGGTLGDGGSVQAITDAHGEWRGYLPPGSYTVSEAAGSRSDVPVIADELTAVIVIDYAVPPRGTLTISKARCLEGEENGTDITVSNDEPGSDGPSCGPANGDFSLASGREITFSLGNDGVATMSLPTGHYTLTDLGSGQTAAIDIEDGTTIFAHVRTVELIGRLVIRHYFCDDPASNDEDPTNATYWKDQCTQPQGGVLTLADGGGNPVATRSGKVITWNELDAGSYSVDSDDGFCATFAGNTDARGGFSVKANATTRVYVYTCAAPSAGGDGSGDGDGGGADTDGGTGGDTTGGASDGQSDAAEVASVTQLPDTGTVGKPGGYNLGAFELLALALPSLMAAAALNRRRWR